MHHQDAYLAIFDHQPSKQNPTERGALISHGICSTLDNLSHHLLAVDDSALVYVDGLD